MHLAPFFRHGELRCSSVASIHQSDRRIGENVVPSGAAAHEAPGSVDHVRWICRRVAAVDADETRGVEVPYRVFPPIEGQREVTRKAFSFDESYRLDRELIGRDVDLKAQTAAD